MPQVHTTVSYVVTYTAAEYKLVAKALALLARTGTTKVKATEIDRAEAALILRWLALLGIAAMPEVSDTDRAEAAALNDRLLELQAADLRDKLAVVTHKRKEL